MLAASIFAAVVGAVAVADHKQTRHRLDRADVFSWYCGHRQIFCAKTKPESIHHEWETREYAYEAAEAVFAFAFVVAAFWLLRSRRAR
jgi:hypothetical protein